MARKARSSPFWPCMTRSTEDVKRAAQELFVVHWLSMCGWFHTFFLQEGRPVYPLQGHRLCAEKGKENWEQLLASVVGGSINWFPRWKGGRVGVLSSCEGFSNVFLMGTRGCINYNPVLAIRQIGYPMRGAPSEKSITPFIARGFSDPNARILQGVCLQDVGRSAKER